MKLYELQFCYVIKAAFLNGKFEGEIVFSPHNLMISPDLIIPFKRLVLQICLSLSFVSKGKQYQIKIRKSKFYESTHGNKQNFRTTFSFIISFSNFIKSFYISIKISICCVLFGKWRIKIISLICIMYYN